MIELTHETIDSAKIVEQVSSTQAGAVVLFLGTVREMTGNRQTVSLEYEGYHDMAMQKMRELEQQAGERWPLIQCAMIHRLGHLELGEVSVAVAVSSAHRQVAFDAAKWLIDTLKQTVPIWKKENWADGTSEWVHPGLTTPAQQPK